MQELHLCLCSPDLCARGRADFIMGRKRARICDAGRNNKRPCVPRRKRSVTDLEYISSHDYVSIGNFLYVRPYVFEFRSNFKPRWRHRAIYDVFCEEFKHTDESYWKKEVVQGRILANGEPITRTTLWDDGVEVIHVVHRHESAVLSTPIHIAENEKGFVVVSKPPSLPIHPCGTYRRNSLQFILKAFYGMGDLLAVHRLDKETSGLVILAKDAAWAAQFCAEIKDHKVEKTYIAEVHGHFPDEIAECTEPLLWDKREMRGSVASNGMEARTIFKRLLTSEETGTSFVECKPVTGRTHQIRIHLAHLGHSIINDPLYGTNHSTAAPLLMTEPTQDPKKITLSHPAFQDSTTGGDRRRTYLATEWSVRSLEQNGRHLSCLEEGRSLSCSNCPQVTNIKNVEFQQMFIHLHALRYESENWKFEVPPPKWMNTKQAMKDNTSSRSAQRICTVC